MREFALTWLKVMGGLLALLCLVAVLIGPAFYVRYHWGYVPAVIVVLVEWGLFGTLVVTSMIVFADRESRKQAREEAEADARLERRLAARQKGGR